ncbi:MAG TPA: hypothetical protein VGZ00_07980 [Candidatus Baltobacteraceae bacterium]|nr:hypothetical protein [Candidatus Baltobacteraceae bacterium]
MSTLSIQPPHAVYDLRADEIANGGGLETAHATGFRYFVNVAGALVAAAEIQTGASGESSLLANVNHGPYVAASARAFDTLTSRSLVGKGSYEARLLRFSAIYLVAVWLKAEGLGADIIYPLAPTPKELSAEKSYSAEDFLEAVRPLVKKRAENQRSGIVP